VEKSIESRTIGEYAVRSTTSAISSAIEPSAFLTISSVMASVPAEAACWVFMRIAPET
jgi:hypothetical protein